MKNLTSLVLIFFVNYVFSEDCKEIRSKSPEMRIKKYLFCNYDDDEPPINWHGNSTRFSFGLLPRIANFDEETDNLEIQTDSYIVWVDERLTWDMMSFNNTRGIFIPNSKFWSPDIAVLSPGGGEMVSYDHQKLCLIGDTNGHIYCTPSITLTTRCQTDFTLWPFDRQNCTLLIGSWSYTSNEFVFNENTDLLAPYMDHFTSFSSNAEWDTVVSRTSYDRIQSHYFQNMTTAVLSIDIILDRVHDRISGIYVTPGIILIIMTLTTVWLDPRSIERLSVACLNPMIHLICMQNLHWALPHNGATVPHILIFYIGSFSMATIALLMTFLLRKIGNIEKSPPKWISATAIVILRSKIGRILLLSVLDPKVSAGIENNADDRADLLSSPRREPTWGYITILLGWLSFIGFFFACIIMYNVLMPNSSMRPPLSAEGTARH